MMRPVERLRAAIEKVERLRGSGTSGPWVAGRDDTDWDGAGVASSLRGMEDGAPWLFGQVDGAVDAELIVMLHRTIDAQVAILRDAFERYSRDPECASVAPSGRNALALADAILGGAS